jgi:DNA-binding transcriptional regulator YhcF (GntR family)
MDFEEREPIYLQISDYICENILAKKWGEGDRIPSVRELSVSIEVNPNTVMRTYLHLQQQDIITNQRGIGYFVAENAYEKTLDIKKREFLTEELPRVFKKMELLKFTIGDLGKFYEEYKNAHKN